RDRNRPDAGRWAIPTLACGPGAPGRGRRAGRAALLQRLRATRRASSLVGRRISFQESEWRRARRLSGVSCQPPGRTKRENRAPKQSTRPRVRPQRPDILLLTEGSDSSVDFDRSVKAALYAAASVPELVDCRPD